MNATVILRYLLFVMALLPLQSCSAFYYKAEPIEAWVVDAETKQPIEGVIVVAHWELKGGMEGNVPVGQMMVMETVTDAKGRFYFPGWGPKLRPLASSLKTQSPGLLLFKRGHEFRELENQLTSKSLRGELDSPLGSDWDRKTIQLVPFNAGAREYASHLSLMHTAIRSILSDKECEWKKMPNLVIAVDRLEKEFRLQGIYSPLYSIEDLPSGTCGSAKDFFRGNMQ